MLIVPAASLVGPVRHAPTKLGTVGRAITPRRSPDGSPVDTNRQVIPAIVAVDHRDGARTRRGCSVVQHGEDIGLASVGKCVCSAQHSDVIHVNRHVCIDDELRDTISTRQQQHMQGEREPSDARAHRVRKPQSWRITRDSETLGWTVSGGGWPDDKLFCMQQVEGGSGQPGGRWCRTLYWRGLAIYLSSYQAVSLTGEVPPRIATPRRTLAALRSASLACCPHLFQALARCARALASSVS